MIFYIPRGLIQHTNIQSNYSCRKKHDITMRAYKKACNLYDYYIATLTNRV